MENPNCQSVELINNFLLACTLVIKYNLQHFLESRDVLQLAKSILLYRDQQDFMVQLLSKRDSSRGDDFMTSKMKKLVAGLRRDHNISMVVMEDPDAEKL